ncbi:MAG: hypothetical protein Dasosvirus3_21 [Dasosvirus sp.]|uniref:Uncharacterized protein n=1 Tax=Dasosvirus sp. TaxID=2487764 RepID=A0A3G4ZRC0_9VIRU|nr:MAG: hypothetical protein Dasosvirus3_21 [Dasosvirus sp.]
MILSELMIIGGSHYIIHGESYCQQYLLGTWTIIRDNCTCGRTKTRSSDRAVSVTFFDINDQSIVTIPENGYFGSKLFQKLNSMLDPSVRFVAKSIIVQWFNDSGAYFICFSVGNNPIRYLVDQIEVKKKNKNEILTEIKSNQFVRSHFDMSGINVKDVVVEELAYFRKQCYIL